MSVRARLSLITHVHEQFFQVDRSLAIGGGSEATDDFFEGGSQLDSVISCLFIKKSVCYPVCKMVVVVLACYPLVRFSASEKFWYIPDALACQLFDKVTFM